MRRDCRSRARNISVIGTFPAGSHEPITDAAGIAAESSSPVTEACLDYLTADTAQAIWREFGFSVLD